MATLELERFKETVQVLIGSCGDKEEAVNTAVVKALVKLASVHPNEVLTYLCEFCKDPSTINPVQLGNIIKVLEQTCVNHMKLVNKEIIPELVETMLHSMTLSLEYLPTIQMGASSVLVAISHLHLDAVLQALIRNMSPSTVPHYTVPHTLGTLAAVNTRDVVPFIKDVLGKLLPLLPVVKVDGVKQAFAYAFGHFAVAVSEQIGDNVVNDITSIKENFVVEFSIVFDVLYNQWLQSHEAKVTESVLEALGPITRLISERKFDETVNKLVLALLALYRKPTLNPFYISQCISYLLTPSPLNPKLNLNDNVINSTNHVMFQLVVLEPDYDQPQIVKNHFEVLRCFDHMAGQFPEPTIEGLLQHCKNNQERDRMKAVIILTHLTTSSQLFIDKYVAKFVAVLKVMTSMESGLKMKKLLVKAIVGLVYRNCITTAEDFTMIEFIIKHYAFDAANGSKEDVVDLHETCRSSLILLCNSVTGVRSQLRDLLLRALTVDEFTPSMQMVSHCLTSLLQNDTNNENPDHASEFKVSPDLVFVRCLTHLADSNQTERNTNLLRFLDEYSGDVHKNLKSLWNVEVQRLVTYVAQHEPEEGWHEMLMNLVLAAIEQVNNAKWVENIATLLSQQILSTKQAPVIKGVSLQYLALLTCQMSNAAVMEQMLKIILLALKSIPMESVDYVSKAIGIASRQHGEYVLNELDSFYKEIEGKRGNKILNFISSRHSKSETEMSVSKYAVIVSYGKVAKECLDVHVLARLGEHVTANLLELLKSHPPLDLCRASVTTLYEIGTALQPAAHHNVVLRNRWQLLNAVLEQIFNPNLEKRNVELFPIVVKASNALTKLQKGILPEERNTIVRVLFKSILGELSSFQQKFETVGSDKQNDILAKTLNDSLVLLNNLMRELVIQSTCLSTIDDLVGLLLEWIRHENHEIRRVSTQLFQVILDSFYRNVKVNFETPSKFGQMGFLLGLIISGIGDVSLQVRSNTVECIKLIVKIQYIYEGRVLEDEDACVDGLSRLNVHTNDQQSVAEYSKELTDLISEVIPHQHTMQFVESLLECFDDIDLKATVSSAVLDALIVKKGQDLYQSIERIVETILQTMERVSADAGALLLGPVSSLGRHHANALTAVLLAQKLPLNACVLACWRRLACDATLAAAILDNFLRLMTSAEMFEDPYHVTERHVAALQPLTLITALGEMLQEPATGALCVERFPDVFVVLYTTVACYLDADPPAYSVPASRAAERRGLVPNGAAARLSPARAALAALCALLERAGRAQIKEACILCMSKEHGGSMATLQQLVPALLRGLRDDTTPSGQSATPGRQAEVGLPHVPRIVSLLAPHARSPLPPRRVACFMFCAEYLNLSESSTNPATAELALSLLSAGWRDSVPRVRAAALRCVPAGAGAGAGAALAAVAEALDAEYSGPPVDNVPLAALQGLARLLAAPPAGCERELMAAALKTRAFMNTDCGALREHAIRLFGMISVLVPAAGVADQALACLPCFLLHLCDANPAVVRASKYTLKQVFSVLPTPRCSELVRAHLLDEGRLYLEDFLSALLRRLAAELPAGLARCLEAAVGYLSSAREDLRPYAPLLIGKLYAELHNLRQTHPDEAAVDDEVTRTARARLTQLINDPSWCVRAHAAGALAASALARPA